MEAMHSTGLIRERGRRVSTPAFLLEHIQLPASTWSTGTSLGVPHERQPLLVWPAEEQHEVPAAWGGGRTPASSSCRAAPAAACPRCCGSSAPGPARSCLHGPRSQPQAGQPPGTSAGRQAGSLAARSELEERPAGVGQLEELLPDSEGAGVTDHHYTVTLDPRLRTKFACTRLSFFAPSLQSNGTPTARPANERHQSPGAGLTWEEREEADDLEEDAADAPHVHLVRVVAVREQALGRAVPARGDVLRVRLLRVDAATAAEVRQLHTTSHAGGPVKRGRGSYGKRCADGLFEQSHVAPFSPEVRQSGLWP
jgi:hypothetical protein